jgi:hypothetical protein
MAKHAGVPVRALGVALLALAMAGSATQPTGAAEQAAPSAVSGGGLTLHSVSVEFPESDRTFPGGAKADVVNNNCLACHSVGMVLTQPRLSRAEWQSEVDKMRNTYRAPIDPAEVPAIVDYLADLGGER